MSKHADMKEGGGWVFHSECPTNCLVWQVGGVGSAPYTRSAYGGVLPSNNPHSPGAGYPFNFTYQHWASQHHSF